MSLDPLKTPHQTELLAADVKSAAGVATTTDVSTLRPVKTGEVIKFGKRSCRTCFGQGLFLVAPSPAADKQPKVCGCAIANFVKKNAANLTYHQEEGSWYWTT